MKPKTKHSLSLNTNETKTAAVLTSNLVVDNENWVCRHCLQQFNFRKWCRVCFGLFKLFVNGMFTECFHPFFFSSETDFLFYYFHQLTLQIVRYIQVYSIILALCTLGYAVCIFCTTDAKYVMFYVGWCKSVKDGATTGIPSHTCC